MSICSKKGRNQLRDLPGKEEKEDLKLQAEIFQAQELLKVSDHFLFSSQVDRLIEICIQASRFAVINKFVLVYDPLERAKLLFCSSEWINAGIDYIAKELASLFVTALLELKSNQTSRFEFTQPRRARQTGPQTCPWRRVGVVMGGRDREITQTLSLFARHIIGTISISVTFRSAKNKNRGRERRLIDYRDILKNLS